MRARHHKVHGEKGVAHRARGGGVHHHHSEPVKVIAGEGDKAKLHAARRARGGTCWYCGRDHASGKASGGSLKLNPPSKGHKPKGAHGRAAVHALGRTKTTGNFAKIEKTKGKGAAIAAYQNALHAHKHG